MKVFRLLFAVALLSGCAKKKPVPVDDIFQGVEHIVFQQAETSEVFVAPDMLTIYFDTDKYDFNLMASLALEKNVEDLLRAGFSNIVVEGHADERHTEEYNLILGVNRAQAVAEYLGELGFSVAIESYGETHPLCMKKTESCWWRNRRAIISILP